MASRTFPTIEQLVAGRTEDLDWTIFGPDKRTPLVLEATDVVRFKLSATAGGDPLLDLRSGEATAAGSTVTITDLDPATGTVRLAQGDTAELAAGTYWGELILVDARAFRRLRRR